LRLIVPFGLQVRPGDIVHVGEDGGLSLEGTTESLLGLPASKPRPATSGGVIDIMRTSKDGTQYTFRGKGQASTLFKDLPKASAGVDIEFGSSRGWILAVIGRSLSSLDEVNRYRKAIKEASERDIWDPNWALITA